jgi:hypothetical protein
MQVLPHPGALAARHSPAHNNGGALAFQCDLRPLSFLSMIRVRAQGARFCHNDREGRQETHITGYETAEFLAFGLLARNRRRVALGNSASRGHNSKTFAGARGGATPTLSQGLSA